MAGRGEPAINFGYLLCNPKVAFLRNRNPQEADVPNLLVGRAFNDDAQIFCLINWFAVGL